VLGGYQKNQKQAPAVIRLVLRVHNRDSQKPKNWFSDYTNMPLSNILKNQITMFTTANFLH
jgi:hypothetical protein